jgi:hypothetical protein
MNSAWHTVTGYKQIQQSVMLAAAACACAACWAGVRGFGVALVEEEGTAVMAVPEVGTPSIGAPPPPRARS